MFVEKNDGRLLRGCRTDLCNNRLEIGSLYGGVNQNHLQGHRDRGRPIRPTLSAMSADGQSPAENVDVNASQVHADDHILLRKFISGCSDDAFAELVKRHINLVHSTASRILGDQALAEDVAQTVFLDLARKAKTLNPDVVLVGWLYRSTCFAAFNLLRRERRRRRRELEATKITQVRSEGRPVWEALAAFLESAVEQLSQADQKAVRLRFVEGRSLRETGQALGLSENTAQKRIARGVQKLRRYFITRRFAVPESSRERRCGGNNDEHDVAPTSMPARMSMRIEKGLHLMQSRP